MTEPRRVLQLSTMVPPARFGGAESVVALYANQLQEQGFRVFNEGLKPRGQPGPATPIPNVYWPFDGNRRGALPRLAWHAIDALTAAGRSSVERIVENTEPDIVITHNLRGWGLAPWAVAKRHKIPLVHVIHDYGLLCNTSTLWHDGGPCGALCRVRARRSISQWPGGMLVGVSQAVLAEHRRHGFGVSDTAAIVHPVHAAPTETYRRTPTSRATFGFLGRLVPEKGLALLLDAINGTGADLIVAGDGEASYVQTLKSRATERVGWLGWTDPAELFAQIDVLVVPSLWQEPFGLVVVEAAHAGVPVLIADQPGLVEAAQASGSRYRTFSSNNVAALRESLGLPLDDYRTHLGSAPEVDIVDVVRQVLGDGQRLDRA